mgnify:CR=1 FL=1
MQCKQITHFTEQNQYEHFWELNCKQMPNNAKNFSSLSEKSSTLFLWIYAVSEKISSKSAKNAGGFDPQPHNKKGENRGKERNVRKISEIEEKDGPSPYIFFWVGECLKSLCASFLKV